MTAKPSAGHVRSMTGFGRGEAVAGGLLVSVELSSLNRRQFDFSVNLPRELAALDALLAQTVRTVVKRGQVKGSVRITAMENSKKSAGAQIDVAMAGNTLGALRRAGTRLKLKDDLALRDLLQLPGLFVSPASMVEPDKIWPHVRLAAGKALRQLDRMRLREGKILQRDIARRCRRMTAILPLITRREPVAADRYRRNMLRRLRSAGLPLDVSDPSITREIAIFADRCDISEEITRLASHLDQFEQLQAAATGHGRALDFLCQECLREINTIGAKAADEKITRQVISFKSELEAVREQVQNIE